MSDPLLGTRRVVVLDDDPTGTQAARDVTVLLQADEETLTDVLTLEHSVYVQTNSRALPETEAVAQVGRIRELLDLFSRERDIEVRIVLRGDSTLRGHVFAESRVLFGADSVMLFVPAFPEGGRLTRDGVHLLRRGDEEIPVGETEFARDPVFGFVTSDLRDFVQSERARRPSPSIWRRSVRADSPPRCGRRRPVNYCGGCR